MRSRRRDVATVTDRSADSETMRLFALSLTFLLARAGAEIGPHLLDGTDTPTLHRDIAKSQVSIEELLKPFAG